MEFCGEESTFFGTSSIFNSFHLLAFTIKGFLLDLN
jgi:hypothetical protein